jgi:hypothetical protein
MEKDIWIKPSNMTNITAVLSKDDYRTFTQKVDIASSKGVDIPHIVEYDTVLDTYEVTLLDRTKTMEELDRITS